MAILKALVLALVAVVALSNGCGVHANFAKSTYVNWGSKNAVISEGGKNLALMLNRSSGMSNLVHVGVQNLSSTY